MTDVFDDIKKIEEAWTFEEDKKKARQWELQARSALAKSGAIEVDGVKLILGELRKEIEAIITKLCWDNGLPEQERRDLIQKRKDYLWFISLFEGPSKELASIKQKVLNEIKNL